MFNKGSKTISNFNDIGLIVENVFYEERFLERYEPIIKLPDNNVLIKMDSYVDFKPQTWTIIEVILGEKKHFKKELREATIRVLKDNEIIDIPIHIEYQTYRIN